MMWMYAGLAGLGVGLAVGVLRFLAYDNAYKHASNTTTTTYNIAGSTLMTAIMADAVEDAAYEAGAVMDLYGAMESVHYGLWNAMTDEERADAIAEEEEGAEEEAAE